MTDPAIPPMTALNPVETIGEQVDEVLRIHTELKDRDRKAKVIEILTAMRLPDPQRLYDAYPHQISGGRSLPQGKSERETGG